MLISNLMCTTCFWNNLHWVCSKSKYLPVLRGKLPIKDKYSGSLDCPLYRTRKWVVSSGLSVAGRWFPPVTPPPIIFRIKYSTTVQLYIYYVSFMFSTYYCMIILGHTPLIYALKNRKSIYGFPTQNLLTLYLNNFLLHKQLVNIVTIMSYYTIYCNILGSCQDFKYFFKCSSTSLFTGSWLSIKILTFSCTCISYTIL
jgi:hypothetical protein